MASVTGFLRAVRNGLLGVLELSNPKESKPPHWFIQFVLFVVKVLQLYSFVTTSFEGFTWPSSLSPMQSISSLTTLSGYNTWVSKEQIILGVWAALAWILVLFVLLAWGTYCYSINNFPVIWPLRILNHMGRLSAGFLFIPLLQFLMQGSSCANTQGGNCSSFGTYGQIVMCTLAGIFIVSFSLLIQGVFYNSKPFTEDYSAQTHGRMLIVQLLMQVVLVVEQQLNRASVNFHLVVIAIVGVGWLVAQVYFMPFYSYLMNRAWTASSFVFLAGVIANSLLFYYPTTDGALTFYLLAITGIGCGVALADARANQIFLTASDRLGSVFEVDIKGRFLIHQSLYGHPFFHSEDFRHSGGGVFGSGARMSGATAPTSPHPVRGGGKGEVEGGYAAAAQQHHSQHAYGHTAGLESASGLQQRMSPESVHTVLELYRSATLRFEKNAFAHLFASRAYRLVADDRHLQMSHLLQASRCAPALDLAYTIVQSRRTLENESIQKRGGVVVNALSRVQFEKNCHDARRAVQRAAIRQMNFWQELSEVTPDITRLFNLAEEIDSAVQEAEVNFAAIFVVSPQALTQLRLYAAFNMHVTGNVEKAGVLMGEADRIEDSRSREHRTEAGTQQDILTETELEIWSESTAVLQISSQERDMGVITEVNSAACRLFGYSRLQMERRSIFSFLPPVLDRVHELSLKSYAKSGEAEMGVVDYTRVSLVVTKAGVLLPVLSSFKDAQGVEDAARYIWALRELRTDTNYVLLSPFGAILGVSGGSQVLLGVDTSTLVSSSSGNNGGVGVPPIPTFFQDWDAPGKQEALRRPAGSSLTLILPSGGAGGTGTAGVGGDAGAATLSPAGGGEEGGGVMSSTGVRRGSALKHSSSSTRQQQDLHQPGGASGGEDEWAEAFGIASPAAAAATPSSRRGSLHSLPATSATAAAATAAAAAAPPPLDPAVTIWARLQVFKYDSGLVDGGEVHILHWQRPSAAGGRLGGLGGTMTRVALASPAPTLAQGATGVAGGGRSSSRGGGGGGREPSPNSSFRSAGGGRGGGAATNPRGSSSSSRGRGGRPAPSGSDGEREEEGVDDASMEGGDSESSEEGAKGGRGRMGGSSRGGFAAASASSTSKGGGRSSSFRGGRGAGGGGDGGDGGDGGEDDSSHPPPPSYPPSEDLRAAGSRTPRHLAGGGGSSSLKPSRNVTIAEEAFEVKKKGEEGGIAGGGILVTTAGQGGAKGDGDSGSDSSYDRSSVGSTTRSLVRLRRILSDPNPPYLTGLVWLRGAGLALLLLSIGLATLVVYISRDNLLQVANIVNYLGLAVQRAVVKATAILSIQDLANTGRGWYNYTEAQKDTARASLVANATLFNSLHLAMYNLVSGAVTPQWTTRYITMTSFIVPAQGLYTRYTKFNLVEVGSMFADLCRTLADKVLMPDSAYASYWDGSGKGEPNMASLHTDFMSNGNAHEAMASSIPLGYSQVKLFVASVSFTQLVVFGGMLSACIIISLGVFLPILTVLELAGDKLMVNFVDTPGPIRKMLYQVAIKRLRNLKRDYAEDEDDDDLDADEANEDAPLMAGGDLKSPKAGGASGGEGGDDSASARMSSIGEEDDPGSAEFWSRMYNSSAMTQYKASAAAEVAELLAAETRGGIGAGGATAGSLPSTLAADGTDAEYPATKGMPKAALRRLRRKRAAALTVPKYKKGASTTIFLIIRFLSPVLVLVALFSTIYGTYLNEIGKVQELTSIAAAAGIRASCARQALTELRKLEYLTTDSVYLSIVYFYTMSKMDCVKHHMQLLSFGTVDPSLAGKDYVAGIKGAPESGAVSSLSPATTAAVYQAMFGDACGFLEHSTIPGARAPGFEVNACRLFYGGIMNQGLAAAINSWWQQGYISADRQLKGLFTATPTGLQEGRGWSIPSNAFNYSAIVCLGMANRCTPDAVTSPASAPLLPSYVSDPAYVGDIPVEMEPFLPNGTVPYWIANELNAPFNVFMIIADRLYITPLLIVLSTMYSNEALATSSNFISFLLILVPIFMTFYALVTLFWFLPQTRRENRNMQLRRSMLLYLPVHVLHRQKPLRDTVTSIIAADAAASLKNAKVRSKVAPSTV